MGTSTLVGHYVCHLLKDNQWVMFNDEKVRFSPFILFYITMMIYLIHEKINKILLLNYCRFHYANVLQKNWDTYTCINGSIHS